MATIKRPKIRSYIKKVITVLLPLFSTLFIVGTTAIIIALINGYSLDFTKRAVIKTGVLNVETIPTDADINVSGEYYGKSNRAIPNLRIGDYTVSLSKEGYYSYTKKVEVQHGLASPVIVPLLRTDGQKEIIDLSKTLTFDSNSTGYYVLSSAELVTEGTTSEAATPTPTPTKEKAKQEPTNSYVLTRIYVTKPLFDDPHPVLDEKMTITTLAATPISSISVSPTGKLLLVTLTDKTGNKSISLVPFKRNSSVNANLTDAKSLTSYNKMKGTTLKWSENGDYIIVDTPDQIISYNVKAGTRVILAEKSELTANGEKMIWNMTESGIAIIRKLSGTKTNTYEINDVSYNGNPLTTQLPTLQFEQPPTNIWSFSTDDTPRFLVTTKTASYLVGKLYDAKESDYSITLTQEKIGDITIEHFAEDYSRIKISSEEITVPPIFINEKHMLSFTENKGTHLVLFIYNKRSADKLTKLGRTELFSAKDSLSAITPLALASYIAAKSADTLIVSDTTGENVLTFQTGLQTFVLGQNDTALMFTDQKNILYFRVIR